MFKLHKEKLRRKLISEYGSLLSHDPVNVKDLQDAIVSVMDDLTKRGQLTLSEHDRQKILSDLVDEFMGFGPIDSLMNDPAVTEIMINGPKKIYAEKYGKTQLTNITFDDEQQLMTLIYKILSATRRHVDETYPYTEIALKGGARANIIIPPLALDGPTITIRKFSNEINNVEDLIRIGTLDKRISDFLIAAVKAKINIIFSGATGAGKTTSLNVFSSYIGNDERVITIEDTAELRLAQEHVVRLEVKQATVEGKGEIGVRELFRNSLRMRPDRIILGEIRGAEVIEMIQAICSGHRGSLSVIHASSPQEVIYRIETMILTSGMPISLEVIHRQIAAAINLIVHQEQLHDGSRKVMNVTQINGLKDGRVVLEDIFVFQAQGTDSEGRTIGNWKAQGIIPVFYSMIKKAGIDLPQEIFNKE
jgi:pilus assembly protein CpaF